MSVLPLFSPTRSFFQVPSLTLDVLTAAMDTSLLCFAQAMSLLYDSFFFFFFFFFYFDVTTGGDCLLTHTFLCFSSNTFTSLGDETVLSSQQREHHCLMDLTQALYDILM